MTKSVEVFEGDTLMLTRKVTEDWLLLQPTPSVKRLVGYLVVYWADRYDIEVLAVIVLGNHLHVIYRQSLGNGPTFCQMVAHWIARIMNLRLDRVGQHFFAPGPCRPMRCLTPQDVENKLDYVVTNATRHGLSEKAYSWPGLLFGPEQVGEIVTFERPPELRFSKVFTPTASHVVPAPIHLRHLPDRRVSAIFAGRRQETEQHEYRERDGNFMGVERAMTLPRFSRPKSIKNSNFKPFFTSCDPAALALAKRSRAVFLSNYDGRLERFRAGDLASDWPPGTYKMRRTYGLPP